MKSIHALLPATWAAAAGLIGFGLLACSPPERPTAGDTSAPTAPPKPVGSAVCAGCHAEEAALWQGSHHDLAMQPANEETVLGDFTGATLSPRGDSRGGETLSPRGDSRGGETLSPRGDQGGNTLSYAGTTTTFSRRDGHFLVRTDDVPGGEVRDYEIAYTFGVEPLQQYLVAFPDGRYQALSAAWDTRPATEGGQRWFHLYPNDEVEPGHPLHWTGPLQNWNFMCAECHSTALARNYRPSEDRYETSFAEIDVSCEACHGPGSRHVAWAEKKKDGGDTGLVVDLGSDAALWSFDESGIARRQPPRSSHTELETCGRCHARRAPITDGYRHGRPLADSYRVALLEELLYHPDGQIKDEVYVYGSFIQSAMHREGVTCGDCHDPHTTRLLADGNAVCARCHLPVRFDTPDHHFHADGGEGSRCVDCHMQAETYMVVDPRHDHSFRVPRPDLSVKIGVPNACNDCHRDHDAAWAADVLVDWYGAEQRTVPHYGEAIHAGRTWQPEGREMLSRVVSDPLAPGIVRATALGLLPRYFDRAVLGLVETALGDGDPLVRRSALGALEALDPAVRLRLAYPMLADPVRTVRIEAARVLAEVPASRARDDQLDALRLGLEEYRNAQQVNLDRAEARLNLAWLDLGIQDFSSAEATYRQALELQPGFVPTWINLADLLRQLGRDGEGEALLRQALEIFPEEGSLHHALGLNLVRRQRLPEAAEAFERAVALEPGEPRFPYVHAVALHSMGAIRRALAVLEQTHQRFPAHRETVAALASFYRDRGQRREAREYARKLVELAPDDPAPRQLLKELGTVP